MLMPSVNVFQFFQFFQSYTCMLSLRKQKNLKAGKDTCAVDAQQAQKDHKHYR